MSEGNSGRLRLIGQRVGFERATPAGKWCEYPLVGPVTLMPAAITDGAEIGKGTGARRSTNAILRLTSDLPQALPEQTNVCGMKMIYNAADSRVSSICRTIFLAWLTAPRAIFRIF